MDEKETTPPQRGKSACSGGTGCAIKDNDKDLKRRQKQATIRLSACKSAKKLTKKGNGQTGSPKWSDMAIAKKARIILQPRKVSVRNIQTAGISRDRKPPLRYPGPVISDTNSM